MVSTVIVSRLARLRRRLLRLLGHAVRLRRAVANPRVAVHARDNGRALRGRSAAVMRMGEWCQGCSSVNAATR